MLAGGFTECSGLISDTNVIEYREGNDAQGTTRKQPGLCKYNNIVLRRGYTDDDRLWKWRKKVVDGKTERTSGTITLLDEARQPALRWNFREGWPAKLGGPRAERKDQRSRRRGARDRTRRHRARRLTPEGAAVPAYLTPGVYRTSTASARERFVLVRTDVAGFLGFSERGPLPPADGDFDVESVCVKLTSWREYVVRFGGFIPHGYLAYAVRAFFENGGDTCYVARVAATKAASAEDRPAAAIAALPIGEPQRAATITDVHDAWTVSVAEATSVARLSRASDARHGPRRSSPAALTPSRTSGCWRSFTATPAPWPQPSQPASQSQSSSCSRS